MTDTKTGYEGRVKQFGAALQSAGFLQCGIDVPELHSLIRHYFPDRPTVAWRVTREQRIGDGWYQCAPDLFYTIAGAEDAVDCYKRNTGYRNITVTELCEKESL